MSKPKLSRKFPEFPDQITRLRLSWRFPNKNGANLAFNKDAWPRFNTPQRCVASAPKK